MDEKKAAAEIGELIDQINKRAVKTSWFKGYLKAVKVAIVAFKTERAETLIPQPGIMTIEEAKKLLELTKFMTEILEQKEK